MGNAYMETDPTSTMSTFAQKRVSVPVVQTRLQRGQKFLQVPQITETSAQKQEVHIAVAIRGRQ